MDRQCYAIEGEINAGEDGRGIVPGLGISEEALVDRAGREVIVVLDHDGLVRLGDDLSVGYDFDHFYVSLRARREIVGCA